MKLNNSSQISIEYLLIFVIGFSIIIAFSGIFYSYTFQAKTQLDKKQIDKIGNQLISNIEKVYFLGNGNKFTLKKSFPNGISNFTIYHKNNTVNSQSVAFDYLDIKYIDSNGKYVSNIYTTSEPYIRFNCSSQCNHDYINNKSYFNSSFLYSGLKEISILSKGSYVELSFKN